MGEQLKKKNISVGLLAHVDAGKTTLSEGLLFQNGSIRKLGRVDNGDAFLDTYALEKERGITIFSKQAVLKQDDMVITLLDTPGHVDFSAEMERTLQVLDAAVLLISASDGIKGHTRTLWKLLSRYHVPVFIFVNKMDQVGADKDSILNDIQTHLSDSCIDFTETATPQFYEQIAMCEESLLNEFLETGEILEEEICEKIMSRKIFPCMFGSALKMEGVEEFFDLIKQYTLMPNYHNEFGAKVYKIGRDDQGNRLTYMKITGGSLKVKDIIDTEKINQIRIYSGARFETENEVFPGSVCAVTGLANTKPGDGLGVEKASAEPLLEPVLTYKVELPPETDAAFVLPKFKQLEEEEPALHIVWDEETRELKAHLMGEVQIEILKQIIQERFDMKVNFSEGKILYKETIASVVEGVGHFEPLRHYAEVHLKMEPAEPGTGIQISADCSEDLLARNWQRLVLTHLEEREHRGVLTGAPLTDVKITLVSGKAHLKHTEGGDFRQATYRAVRQGLMQAESVLLEPYYDFRLEIPQAMVGRAMMDLESRFAKFSLESSQRQSGQETMAVIVGSIPVSTLGEYSKDVTSYTRGLGNISCVLKGYYPCHNAAEVVEQKGYDPTLDYRNPADSVFCSHGAGVIVPWNEVFAHMHLPLLGQEKIDIFSQEYYEEVLRPTIQNTKKEKEFVAVEEIDRIIEKTSFSNKKDKSPYPKGYHSKSRESRAAYSGASLASTTREYSPQPKKDKYLLVDGYNVIFAWEELNELAKDNIEGARGKLLDIMCNYQAVKHCEVIVVFDAYRVKGHGTEFLDYHNIHVVYTKQAETADQYIEHFAHEHGKKYDITVATSDGLEQIIIRGQGCALLSSRELKDEIEQSLKGFREQYLKRQNTETDKLYLLDGLDEGIRRSLYEE